MQEKLLKSKILNYISKMKDGELAPYKDESYSVLVDIYCDGANIIIDEKNKQIEKVSQDFTNRRIKYAKEIKHRREVNEPDTGRRFDKAR